MALKNKLSLLCLSIIATNFGIDNVQSDDWNSYNYNRPFTPSNSATRNRNLYNNNRLFTPNNNLLAKGSLLPDKKDWYDADRRQGIWNKPLFNHDLDGKKQNDSKLLFSQSPSDNSNYETDASDNEERKSFVRTGWTRKSAFNQTKNDLQVNFDNDKLLINSSSRLFTNCFLAGSVSTDQATQYKNMALGQLEDLLDRKLIDCVNQLFNLFPNLQAQKPMFSRALSNATRKFDISLDMTKLNNVLNNNILSSFDEYQIKQTPLQNDELLNALLRVLQSLSDNIVNSMSQDDVNSILHIVDYSANNGWNNDVLITTLLNGFIKSLSYEQKQKLLEAIFIKIDAEVDNVNNDSIPVHKFDKLLDIANIILITSADQYSNLMQKNNAFSEATQSLFCSDIKNLNKLINLMSKTQYYESDNVINMLVNKYAGILNYIGNQNNVNHFVGFDSENPDASVLLLMHTLCLSGNVPQYNVTFKDIVTKKYNELYELVVVNFAKYKGRDSLYLHNSYGNKESITASNMIGFMNILIDNAHSQNKDVSKDAIDNINKIKQFANKLNISPSNPQAFLFAIIIYSLGDTTNYDTIEKKLKKNDNYGKRKDYFHTQSKNQPINDISNIPYDVSFLVNSLNNSGQDIHISKKAWDNKSELTFQYELKNSALFGRSLYSTQSSQDDRVKLVFRFIDTLFAEKQSKTKSKYYIFGEQQSIELFNFLIDYNKRNSDDYNQNKEYYNIIEHFITNSPGSLRNKALSHYINNFISHNDIIDSQFTLETLAPFVKTACEAYQTLYNRCWQLVVDENWHLMTEAERNQQNAYQTLHNQVYYPNNSNSTVQLAHKYIQILNTAGLIPENQLLAQDAKWQYILYNLGFNITDSHVLKAYKFMYNKLSKKTPQPRRSAEMLNNILGPEIQDKMNCVASLSYIASNGEENEPQTEDSLPFVKLDANATLLLNKVIANSPLLKNVERTALRRGKAYYKDQYVQDLKTYNTSYCTNFNNITEQSSMNDIAQRACLSACTNIYAIYNKHIRLVANPKFEKFIKDVYINRQTICKVIENVLANPNANIATSMKNNLKKSMFYTWFIIEQIMSKGNLTDKNLLSKQDLNVAAKKAYLLEHGFYDGFTRDLNELDIQADFEAQILQQFQDSFSTDEDPYDDDSVESYDQSVYDY